VGLVPDCNGTWILPKLIGLARAKAITMLATPVSAQQAEQWGMIYACYEDAEYEEKVAQLVSTIASRPTLALSNIKELMQASNLNTYDQQLDAERDTQRLMGLTHDFKEGVKAFAEKRKPEFKGA
jgi:2-(1,2-epoxy-1,2-dihydrophenyl)acetyl-CoA isomerase